jgi:hypothetical protein
VLLPRLARVEVISKPFSGVWEAFFHLGSTAVSNGLNVFGKSRDLACPLGCVVDPPLQLFFESHLALQHSVKGFLTSIDGYLRMVALSLVTKKSMNKIGRIRDVLILSLSCWLEFRSGLNHSLVVYHVIHPLFWISAEKQSRTSLHF